MKFLLVSFACLTAPLCISAQQPTSEVAPPLAPLPPALPRHHTPEPTHAAISAADLKTRLYIYADDSMEGREVGTESNVRATAYLAAEAKRIGLQPGGDQGSYFQVIPTVVPVLAANSTMEIDGKLLTLWKDFAPELMTQANGASVAVIYAGRSGVPTTLTPAQMQGKFVVFGPPLSTSAPINGGPDSVPGAFAVGYIAWDRMSHGWRQSIRYPTSEPVDTSAAQAATQQGMVYLSTAVAQQLFGKPVDELKPGATGAAVSIHYTWTRQPAPFVSRNVVAIVPGSDPVLRNSYIALGAHNDHVGIRRDIWPGEPSTAVDHDSLRVFNHIMRPAGAITKRRAPTQSEWAEINTELAALRTLGPPRPDSIFNGADDDGSGSIALLEIAEYLAARVVKPKRSIIFVWHSGEEVDMRGSRGFLKHPPFPRDSLVAQLNIDMIGRGSASDRPGGGPAFLQVEGARCMSTELGDIVDSVNVRQRHNLQLDYHNKYFSQSDHINYARAGIPVLFFFTDVHSDLHQETDEPQYIDYDHMSRIVSLITDVAINLGDLGHRPVVDKPDGVKTCR